MSMDNLRNTLSREGLFPETSLDVVEHLRVRRVGLVKQVSERQVRRAETVTEVLGKDPATVYFFCC